MKKVINMLSAAILGAALLTASPVLAEEALGTISIPVSEYEKLKEATEAKKDKQYWNMTFEQILDEVKGDESKAWKLYRYYVLRELDLDGVVGAGVATIIKDMNILNEIDNTKPITLVISSSGGYVYNGLFLYNAMMALEAPVHTVCDGMAASMAAVILAVGDHRIARPGCHFMIHELGVGGGGGTQVSGQTLDFVKLAEFTVDLEDILMKILSENTGYSVKEIQTLGEYETFYDAEEILRLGFVDEVVGSKPRELSDYRDIPEDLLPINRMKKNLNEKLDR